jgi:hypothetical protein
LDTNNEQKMNRKVLLTGGAVVASSLLVAGRALAAPVVPAKGEAPQTTADATVGQASVPAAQPSLTPEQSMELWGRSLVLQAATYAAPLVAMYNLRATVAVGPKAKAPPGQIWRFMDIASPKIAAESGYVTPNVNVIYGFGFADLEAEPFILTAPDSGGRYYMIEIVDMWTNAFAYPVGEKAGYKGGKFALVGPGWTGTLPHGVTRIDCPTRWIELQPRVHVKNDADLPGARAVMNAIKLQGLAEFKGGAAPSRAAYDYDVPRLSPGVASSLMKFEDPLQFWSIFVATMNENPPPASEIKSVLPQYRYLGIEYGKPWNSKNVNPIFLAQMKRVVEEFGDLMSLSTPLIGTLKNGWAIPPANQGNSGSDYMGRSVIAVIGLTANTAQEAVYFAGVADTTGARLSGAKKYSITWKNGALYTDVVAPGFWSVTMYDAVTKFTIPNPINRYALGSDDALKMNSDGSFTMYVQHSSPGADKEANWLPAPPGPFYLILRNFAPAPKVAEALESPATFPAPPPIIAIG